MKTIHVHILMGSCLIAFLLLTAGPSWGAFVTFHGETALDLGTGFGNVLQTLVLQASGGGTSESGSVTWDGSNDILTGDAANLSQTQTVADLIAAGFDEENLIIVLNLNQTGSHPALDVHDFAVRFYTSSDGQSFFDAVYDPSNILNTASSLGLMPEGQGVGSAGYAFRISFAGAEGSDFFADNGNRIGTLVAAETPIDNIANDGPETFYVGDADVNQVVPEPVSLAMLMVGGLSGLAIRTKRKSR